MIKWIIYYFCYLFYNILILSLLSCEPPLSNKHLAPSLSNLVCFIFLLFVLLCFFCCAILRSTTSKVLKHPNISRRIIESTAYIRNTTKFFCHYFDSVTCYNDIYQTLCFCRILCVTSWTGIGTRGYRLTRNRKGIPSSEDMWSYNIVDPNSRI